MNAPRRPAAMLATVICLSDNDNSSSWRIVLFRKSLKEMDTERNETRRDEETKSSSKKYKEGNIKEKIRQNKTRQERK